MSEIAELRRALTAIDQAALPVVLNPGMADEREVLIRRIEEYEATLTANLQIADVDIWRLKMWGVMREIRSLAVTLSAHTAPQRLPLFVSYVRTMRGFIVRILGSLPADS